MSLRLKVKEVNVNRAITKGELARKAVLKTLVLAARRDSKPYVPMRKGRLRTTAETNSQPENGLLIYGGGSVKYARVQYDNQFSHYTTAGTGPKWFDKAKSAKSSQWTKEAQEAIKRIMNGN